MFLPGDIGLIYTGGVNFGVYCIGQMNAIDASFYHHASMRIGRLDI